MDPKEQDALYKELKMGPHKEPVYGNSQIHRSKPKKELH